MVLRTNLEEIGIENTKTAILKISSEISSQEIEQQGKLVEKEFFKLERG